MDREGSLTKTLPLEEPILLHTVHLRMVCLHLPLELQHTGCQVIPLVWPRSRWATVQKVMEHLMEQGQREPLQLLQHHKVVGRKGKVTGRERELEPEVRCRDSAP